MLNKILILLLLVSCGRQVDLTNSKLESASRVTKAEEIPLTSTGTLIRATRNGDKDTLLSTGGSLTISPFSSHLALNFIAKTPAGAQVPVRYAGKVSGGEVVLTKLEAQ
jgi:hypothetical protein